MELLTHRGGNFSIQIKNKLHELTLEEFIVWQEAEEEILKIEGKIEDLEILVMTEEVEEDDAELLETEYTLAKYDQIKKQVSLIVSDKDKKALDGLTRLELYELKISAPMEFEEYEKGTVIVIPGANDKQIEDLEESLVNDIPEEDKLERARLKLRIKKLKSNQFILLPVQDAIFATKARTDAIRKQLPSLPEEIRAAQDKEDGPTQTDIAKFIEKLDRELSAKDLDRTQAEVRERLKLKRLIKGWQSNTETEVYKLADQFLTHLLIPVDEEYSSRYAEFRRAHIRKLTMDKVLPFINFILAVLRH